MSLGNESVVQWMTKDVMSVSPHDNVKTAIDLMNKHCIRHLIVVKNDKLVGILSKNDVDKFSLSKDDKNDDIRSKLLEQINVDFVMTKSVNTVEIQDSIKDAAEMLSLSSYHALPVMEDDKLVGIITSTDLIRYLLKHC
jgi:CBS domain-containing protein